LPVCVALTAVLSLKTTLNYTGKGKLEHPRQTCPGHGMNSADEHSSKELLQQLMILLFGTSTERKTNMESKISYDDRTPFTFYLRLCVEFQKGIVFMAQITA
jgi:hypothetical protein